MNEKNFHSKINMTPKLTSSNYCSTYRISGSGKSNMPLGDAIDLIDDCSYKYMRIMTQYCFPNINNRNIEALSKKVITDDNLNIYDSDSEAENITDTGHEHDVPKITPPKTAKFSIDETKQSVNLVPSFMYHITEEVKLKKINNASHNIPIVTDRVHTLIKRNKKSTFKSSTPIQMWTVSEEKIEKEGYLWKKGANKKWTKVYCLLKERAFIWSSSKQSKVLKGCIQFDFKCESIKLLRIENNEGFV